MHTERKWNPEEEVFQKEENAREHYDLYMTNVEERLKSRKCPNEI